MTIEELLNTLKSEFPKLSWQIDERNYIVAYYRNIRFKAYIGNFAESVYNGCEFIGVSVDAHLQGGSRPCIGIEEALSEMRENINRYAPNLLEDEQLALF